MAIEVSEVGALGRRTLIETRDTFAEEAYA